jgi:exopolysaccharide biosynthesis protein
MKRKIISLHSIFVLIAIPLLVATSCSDKADHEEILSPPSIVSMTASCFYNSTVVITGKGFSTNKEDNIVKFGAVSGTVTEAKSTSLSVKVPDLASASTVDVTVTNSGLISNAKSIAIDVDQNKIATYTWTSTITKPGIIYKSGQFSLFGSTQRSIHILDITLDASNTLGIGFAASNISTTAMSNNYNAFAGVNAGYFKLSGSYDKDPYIRIDGAVIQSGDLNVNSVFTNSVLIVNENVATVRKFTQDHYNQNLIAAAIPVAQAKNMIVCGPMLVTSGKIESLDMSVSHNSSQTARTGLGVSADGKRVFLVVVDTGGGFTGVNTIQLAKILQALGAVDAMNFDGGGSSTMFVKNQGSNGLVNSPNGGTYQRPVRSIVYVK